MAGDINAQPTAEQPTGEVTPPRQAPHQRSRRWLRWAVPVVTFVVGASLGFATAGSDPKESEAYRTLEGQLASANDRVRTLNDQYADYQANVDEEAAGAGEKVAQRNAELDERDAAIEDREAELKAAEADVAAREKALTATEEAPKPEPEPEPDLSAGQANAVSQAQNYLALSAFSRSGLIKQLEFEGYSTADATAAVDSIGVDWNEQAAEKAEEYLSLSSFSKTGLVDQLEFEGFTREQAEHGVNKAY